MSFGFVSSRDVNKNFSMRTNHKMFSLSGPGGKRVDLIQTGDRSYCVIGEWEDMAAMAAARPNMIATLNSFRDTLEDLGGGLGVTDAVSGPVVIEIESNSLLGALDEGALAWRRPWDESSSIAVKRLAS